MSSVPEVGFTQTIGVPPAASVNAAGDLSIQVASKLPTTAAPSPIVPSVTAGTSSDPVFSTHEPIPSNPVAHESISHEPIPHDPNEHGLAAMTKDASPTPSGLASDCEANPDSIADPANTGEQPNEVVQPPHFIHRKASEVQHVPAWMQIDEYSN